MMRYLEDGRLLLDNNLAENEIRTITLGKKNYLLCGNHDVNPGDYLNDVISQMPYHAKASHEELLQLLPHKWKLTHQGAVMNRTT